jgi:hypothetical protein
MKQILLYMLLLLGGILHAQNKSGYTWIVGNNASYGQFDGSTNKPITSSLYQSSSPNFPYLFISPSNICDSSSGRILMLCNGMQLFDTLGNLIENGDSLVPLGMYTKNSYPASPFSQSSLILPKGSTGQYYVLIPTVSDIGYKQYWTNQGGKYPYDEILVHIVDMNANGGLGKVIEKNKILIDQVELATTNFQACRHSNGIDWWVLKQGYDSNIVYRFLLTQDSIRGPFVQRFSAPQFGWSAWSGQNCFSPDGKKYASVQGQRSQFFLADFNRCTGELSNPQVFNIPIDSTYNPYYDSIGLKDSIVGGVAFSPNGKFIYISKFYNIFQYEFDNIDSTTAWYRVKQGADTSDLAFENYGQLKLGIDNRIYIGKIGGGFKQFSVIDNPDMKGVGCGFCRKCFRVDNAIGGLNAPPNIPDFNLGAETGTPCWPLSSSEIGDVSSERLVVYPNPASTSLTIELTTNRKGLVPLEMYNMVGELVLKTEIQSQTNVQINISSLPKGLYVIRCKGVSQKVVVE